MFQTILQALVPVIFVAGLGWLVGRLGVLDPQRIRSITTFIVVVALPAALFVGVFSFSRSQLENGRYLLTLAVALMATWAVGLVLARFAFRSSRPSAGMLALNSSFPDLAYFGLPVLTAVIGAQGLLPVIVGNLVISVLMVPLTILMLGSIDGAKHESLFGELKSTVTKPLVWAPVLGAVLVLLGVKLPPLADASVRLVGATAGGTALFALGVMLSGLTPRLDKIAISVLLLKNFAQPAIAVALALGFHFSGTLSKGVVLAAACPCATASAMLASTYRIDEGPTTSAVVVSNIAGIFTMAMWIFIVEKIWT
ncbi:MAG TPA: AEC family transporter [Candidatus Aquilonibacter sp.]|nr:AEC family transporter [Candidatus Aquilonibacter sp.]